MKRTIKKLARDFTLFWHVRVTAWVTRVMAWLPSPRSDAVQDGAIIACFLVTVILLGSGLLG